LNKDTETRRNVRKLKQLKRYGFGIEKYGRPCRKNG
jgi:hypothetical protein